MRSFVIMCVLAALAFANADTLRSLGRKRSSGLPECQLCSPGTDGPCQQSNGVCWAKDPITNQCPTGTSLCKCVPLLAPACAKLKFNFVAGVRAARRALVLARTVMASATTT